MKATIVSYRRGRHTQTCNQMLVLPEDESKAKDLVGKKVIFKTKTKEIVGKVTNLHGRKGVVRVLFETGMPGQSISQEVIISE